MTSDVFFQLIFIELLLLYVDGVNDVCVFVKTTQNSFIVIDSISSLESMLTTVLSF